MKHFDSVITGSGKALARAPAAKDHSKRVCTHPKISGALNGLFAL
ncbi:hypothetical protein SDC9_156783 [bioreactor metagenome]|uniref:Uncharacterized protein n=1 Tax=bioreactor metagenome TaxID=1076179 RepID=A0A645FAK5_9ZZZZ